MLRFSLSYIDYAPAVIEQRHLRNMRGFGGCFPERSATQAIHVQLSEGCWPCRDEVKVHISLRLVGTLFDASDLTEVYLARNDSDRVFLGPFLVLCLELRPDFCQGNIINRPNLIWLIVLCQFYCPRTLSTLI